MTFKYSNLNTSLLLVLDYNNSQNDIDHILKNKAYKQCRHMFHMPCKCKAWDIVALGHVTCHGMGTRGLLTAALLFTPQKTAFHITSSGPQRSRTKMAPPFPT